MQTERAPETTERGEIGLPALVLWLGLFGAALYLLAGWPTTPPSLPESWPSWLMIEVWLRSPMLPTEWLIPLVQVVAWLVWGWTCLTVVLRVVVHALEVITRGAAWVQSLQVASDWLTVPFVRRAVDASLAGLMMARVVVPAPVPAIPHAAGSEVVIASSVAWGSRGSRAGAPVQPAGGAGLVFGPMERTADPDGQSTTAADELVYTIRKGDTWSGIALTFYGTASRAEELLEANVGRQQADGRRINRHGWIYAGWTIGIPRATRGVVIEENGQRWYVVRRGDTLRGICARVLGDEALWEEVFQLNVGARLDDRHVLTDPNLIWPGLRLKLHSDETPPESAEAAEPPAPVHDWRSSMQPRIKNPAITVPGAMQALQQLGAAARSAGVPATTLYLIEVRASQINGCSVCLDMHSRELKAAGEPDERIFMVGAWREAPYFSDAERAALALTEAATRLADRSDAIPDAVWEAAARHYDESQLAGLVVAIAAINAWNRINAATRQIAGEWVGQRVTHGQSVAQPA